MRTDWSHLDKYREPHPVTGYRAEGQTVGCFRIPHPDKRQRERFLAHFFVIATSAQDTGWEHVSVHVRYYDKRVLRQRTPTWGEMCWIKVWFWEDSEAVMQIHPPADDHINVHEHVLHLWRPTTVPLPMPPKILV